MEFKGELKCAISRDQFVETILLGNVFVIHVSTVAVGVVKVF